ncbi:MAG: hypothetical protein CSA75_05105 [Sorangium cellulosum]|nr:MAG: hypothetical protein CSA75_05105 [Sorangium cellulosum]
MFEDAKRAVRAWTWQSQPTLTVNEVGLINQTFVVSLQQRPRAILQRLNTDIFAPEVHEDINAVTTCLLSQGLATPRLLRTSQDNLWHTDPESGIWRCMTYEGDRTILKVSCPQDAHSAGKLAARFHSALQTLNWSFKSVRPGAHDTSAHMKKLEEAIGKHANHRLYEVVAPLAQNILQRWNRVPKPPTLPGRVIHGDLKISNVRFTKQSAHCLIDLDTTARDTIDVELGDAMRSWCNPASEDTIETTFALNVFEAAMFGYASGARERGLSQEEWESIVPAIERISLELASRFACDALQECYFGWNQRFGTRGDHNLLRATGQLALAESIDALRGEADAIVAQARAS